MIQTLKMVITALLALGLVSCVTAPGPVPDAAVGTKPANGRTADELRESIDALVGPAIEEGWIQGMAIAFVHPAGTEMMGYGRVREGEGAPDANTIFEIGSVTKVMSGILLAEMVARGELSFDTPVSESLPDGFEVPSRNDRAITLLDLATHVSGLPRMPDNFEPADPENPYADYGPDRMAAFLAGHELRHDPGSRAEYSNFGMGLLGLALASHAGTTYEELLRERIFSPLGMGDTAIELSEEQLSRLAQGHDGSGNPVSVWDIPGLAGAGAVRSSLADMLTFLQASMGLTDTALSDVIRSTKAIRGPFNEGNTMGLGWLISASGVRWHNGMTGGYHAFLAVDDATGVGMVVLTDTATGLVSALSGAIMRLLRDMPYTFELPKRVTVSEEILQGYVGEYELAPGAIFTITLVDGALHAQLTGQPALQIHPESETEFDYRVVPAKIVFQLDDEGVVTGLVLHQGGQEMPARRLAEESEEEE